MVSIFAVDAERFGGQRGKVPIEKILSTNCKSAFTISNIPGVGEQAPHYHTNEAKRNLEFKDDLEADDSA